MAGLFTGLHISVNENGCEGSFAADPLSVNIQVQTHLHLATLSARGK